MRALFLLALLILQYVPSGNRAGTVVNSNPAPIAEWAMNEGSGLTFNDSSGNSNTATLNTAVTWQANTGLPGTTPLFNGTQSAPSISSTLLNFPASQPFTVGFCSNVLVTATGSTFFSTFANSSLPLTGWEAATIGASGGSLFEFYLINTWPSNAMNVSAPRPDGSTKYIVITYSAFFNGTRYPASDLAVYYNGVAQTLTVGADTLTGDPRTGLPLLIGKRPGGALLSGSMAYLEIWPYAQSSATVATNAALPCGLH